MAWTGNFPAPNLEPASLHLCHLHHVAYVLAGGEQVLVEESWPEFDDGEGFDRRVSARCFDEGSGQRPLCAAG